MYYSLFCWILTMKLMNKYRGYICGAALLIAGAALMYFGFYDQAMPTTAQPINGSFAEVVTKSQPASTGGDQAIATTSTPRANTSSQPTGSNTPINVSVPSVGINLGIVAGYYSSATNQWTLSNSKAQFATMTAKPNTQGGNTFIYGHAKSSIFGRLSGIKSGALVNVTTDSRQQYAYRYRASYTVSPTDTSVLSYTGAPILTLQTCSGVTYENRTMYVFDLVGVRNV